MNAATLAALLPADPYGMKDVPRVPAPAPMELCSFCALSLVERSDAFGHEMVKVEGKDVRVPTRRSQPLTTLKVKGEPCHVCGHAEPAGTYPWRWTVTIRIGDHAPYARMTYYPARERATEAAA